MEKLQGVWRSQFHLWTGDTLAAAGRRVEARAGYQRVMADATAEARFKKIALEKLSSLPE